MCCRVSFLMRRRPPISTRTDTHVPSTTLFRFIMTGCGIFDRIAGDPQLTADGASPRRFLELFYMADGLKSGMHHPDGIFWIRRLDRQHVVHEERDRKSTRLNSSH